ncbi:MAG: hypothetical protein WCK76_13170 [Elusimicrobiota bacterium]
MAGAGSRAPHGLGLLLAALLALGAGGGAAYYGYNSPFPPPQEIRVPPQGAAGDMFALAFGARRLFADMWFVRLMQYYGTEEFAGDDEHENEPGHKHDAHCRHGANFGTGKYPGFLPMARHILEIDPGFVSAGLYGAGSLAFNMGRTAEAEELLAYGLRYSPKEWKYLKVLAAIGYSKAEDPAAVAGQIQPLLKEPDCPVMLKQLAAFLNKKIGNFPAAAVIYADIAATSRDEAYVQNARRELARLARRTVR